MLPATEENATRNFSYYDYAPASRLYPNALTSWFVAMLAFSVCGIFTNGVLMYAVLTVRQLRAGSGFLIAHFLFLELQLCVHMLILSVSTYFFAPHMRLPESFCRYSILLYYTALNAIDWNCLLIGVNRFLAIFMPLSYYKFSKPSVIVLMAAISWAVGFACGAPPALGFGGRAESTRPWGTCGVNVDHRSKIYPAIATIGVTFPVVALGAIYSGMLVGLKMKMIRGNKMVEQTDSKDVTLKLEHRSTFRRRYKSVKMLFVTHLWYVCCLMPAPTASSLYSKQYTSDPLLPLFLRALLLFGYATIPGIYIAMNSGYRYRLKTMFRKAIPRWYRSSQATLTNDDKSVRTGGTPSRHRGID